MNGRRLAGLGILCGSIGVLVMVAASAFLARWPFFGQVVGVTAIAVAGATLLIALSGEK